MAHAWQDDSLRSHLFRQCSFVVHANVTAQQFCRAGAALALPAAGAGNDWLIWQKVQPELAKTMRVCSYDRAGVGWNEQWNTSVTAGL